MNMRPIIHGAGTQHSPDSLVGQLHGETGVVLLRSALFDSPQARYSFVAAKPFLTFRSFGSRCEIQSPVLMPQFSARKYNLAIPGKFSIRCWRGANCWMK